MYDDHFDGGGLMEGDEDDGSSQTHIPKDQSFSMAEKHHPQNSVAEMEQCYNNINCGGMQEIVNGENQYQIYTTGSFPETPYPDLLNMYPLPRCTSSSLLLPSSSNTTNFFGLMFDPVCDPFLPLNLPSHSQPQPQPQPSSLLYHSFPNWDYEREGLIIQNDDGVSGERGCINGKDDVKHSVSERQKRKDFNLKYKALKELIPNPTKEDRASIVGDTIEYINELKRTVSELKSLVEKKRRARERVKNEEKVDDDWVRRSWAQRKSRNAEVDVRIMENDVSMKLIVQHTQINCLLFVAKALDELQLELHHVSGGAIGDIYTYFINSKFCEGSNVYASAVASKIIQVVDQHYIISSC